MLARLLGAAVALSAVSAGGPALGQGAPAATVKVVEMRLPVTRLTLDNGLRVVLHEDHSAPVVAIAVVYDAGARMEDRGRGGVAHLLEHMMFQGSKNVKRGDHGALVASRGGAADSATTADRTAYFEVLPSHELALGLWLEADRMGSLAMTEEGFKSRLAVLRGEHRARVSNVAYSRGSLRLEELVFEGYWPYGHPAPGSEAEIDALQLDWVRDFHAKHHGPNSAVLAVAGDIDPAGATELVHRYFDKLQRASITPFTDAPFPDQTSPRTAVVRDAHARSAAVFCGWRAPAMREPASYALDLLAILLGGGESSRLHQLLVRDRAVAQAVSAHLSARRGPGVFEIDAKLTPEAKVEDVQRLIDGAVRDAAARGPTAAELAKAQRQARSRLVLGLQTNLARATSLAEYELFFGDAGLLAGEAARYLAVTADDVKKAAAAHLAVTKRTVVEVYPVPEPKDEKKGPGADAAADPKKPPAASRSTPDPKKPPAASRSTPDPKKPTGGQKAAPGPRKGGAGGKKAADSRTGKKKGSP